MKSESPTCRLFILLNIILISITTGELEFYQDVESETPEEVNFKTLKRILELKNHQDGMRQTRTESHPYLLDYEDYMTKYQSEKQKTIFEILLENPRILEMLQKSKLKNINYQQRPDYDVNEYPRSIVERERSYVNLESPSKSYKYPNINIPFIHSNTNEKMYFSHGNYNPMRMTHPNWKNFEINLEDNTMKRHQDNIVNSDVGKLGNTLEVNPMPNLSAKWHEPGFTYKFDRPSINEHNIFAIKPNDPRYYEDEALSSSRTDKPTSPQDNNDFHTTEVKNVEKMMNVENPKITHRFDERGDVNNKFLKYQNLMPEPHRRIEQESVIATSTGYKTDNDIYFNVIVAGCSAAAMFALLLISLALCRLQHGTKATADIDYPAYGVTGPNKDVSPSGDQRLAHSAQMYHFQHQKQQIIAMEKTTASREPGSVSEAESDEENEEGDYTVYECPGLAPAGEMEVKNPLFHDDPTPATPSQNHKDMDHSRQ